MDLTFIKIQLKFNSFLPQMLLLKKLKINTFSKENYTKTLLKDYKKPKLDQISLKSKL